MGWIVWRDAPTRPIVTGNAFIIAGGLYFWRGRKGPHERPVLFG